MIIGISGKIGSGKDTVGKIIQFLTLDEKEFSKTNADIIADLKHSGYCADKSNYRIKKFADTLKDMVCLLINCTREQLEDHDFKNTELGEEWWYYRVKNIINNTYISPLFLTKEEAKIWERNQSDYEETGGYNTVVSLIKLTPRLLLQLLGTNCGRDIIHPNIWINALMSEYKAINYDKCIESEGLVSPIFPNWIITDTRFPNELKAVEDRGGISIRVNRPKLKPCPEFYYTEERVKNAQERYNKGEVVKMVIDNSTINEHESETALDNAEFDYTIDNNGTIEDLIEDVKSILIQEKII